MIQWIKKYNLSHKKKKPHGYVDRKVKELWLSEGGEEKINNVKKRKIGYEKG